MIGVVMVMMTVVITQMSRVVLHSSALNVNSDVWMEVVSLEAGAVMGYLTAKMALMRQDAVSALTYKFSIAVFIHFLLCFWVNSVLRILRLGGHFILF